MTRSLTVECLCVPKEPKHIESWVFAQFRDKNEKPPSVICGLGFCNHELRPIFRVPLQDRNKPIEVVAGETVNTPVLHLAGTYDGQIARLYVNTELAGEKHGTGVITTLPPDAGGAMGYHYHGRLDYVRVWRRARTVVQLREMKDVTAPPPNPDPNAPNPGSPGQILDLAYLANDPDCISWWPMGGGPRGLAGRLLWNEQDVRIATRILELSGVPETAQGSPQGRLDRAGKTLLSCCDELEGLINTPTVTEPDVLRFFGDNPHATFLLEDDQEKMWREQPIQGYGQIDFVFLKSNGRYLVVEVEPPKAPLFKKNDEFTDRFNHAVDQVSTWKLGAQKYPDLVEKSLGMTGMQPPDGMVVIGRSADISNQKRQERWHHRCANSPDCLFTWDDIVKRGRSLGARLRNPTLPSTEWS